MEYKKDIMDYIHDINLEQECGRSRYEEEQIYELVCRLDAESRTSFVRLLVQYWNEIPAHMSDIPADIRECAAEQAQQTGMDESLLLLAWLLYEGTDFNPLMGRTLQ